jgi:putative PIN family toxin of toxin-antitoxin system
VLRAVLDTTVLVSAFLNPAPRGAAAALLDFIGGAFDLYLSDDILGETERVLLTYTRIRRRYRYADVDVEEFVQSLRQLGSSVMALPKLRVVRDPNDDAILACAVAARADYLVTRDKDLLSMGRYGDIAIIAPEEFLRLVRSSA